MEPSVGRIVHYVARGSADGVFPKACRAAVITEIANLDRDAVALCVLNPTGIFFQEYCEHHSVDPEYPEGMIPGSWHWPERVD